MPFCPFIVLPFLFRIWTEALVELKLKYTLAHVHIRMHCAKTFCAFDAFVCTYLIGSKFKHNLTKLGMCAWLAGWCSSYIWAATWRNLFLPYANNKGADQPAHPRSLISTFVVRSLDSKIPLLAIAKISRLLLVSVTEKAGLSLSWSETPKTGFLMTRHI